MRYGIIGYSGRMGRELTSLLEKAGHERVLAVDSGGESIGGTPRVILDFSLPSAWGQTLRLCRAYNSALVLGTTGLGDEQLAEVRTLAKTVPVVHSSNFGVGTNILAMIMQDYRDMFSEWDMEIEELHHDRKKDAPSGTALMLMDAAGRVCPAHSLRLGNLPGDHVVYLALGDELLSFTHRAVSRSIFARGAVKAAEFAAGAEPGYYNFRDVLRAAM